MSWAQMERQEEKTSLDRVRSARKSGECKNGKGIRDVNLNIRMLGGRNSYVSTADEPG